MRDDDWMDTGPRVRSPMDEVVNELGALNQTADRIESEISGAAVTSREQIDLIISRLSWNIEPQLTEIVNLLRLILWAVFALLLVVVSKAFAS